ncbi:MAG: riboflavin synthase [Gammaproteobacteria bacterium]|nr:MAG: riboflavin synthase [Gammaproteobacteria bacterium]
MFTGIIEATGKTISLKSKGSDARISIYTGRLDLSDSEIGDSIAVNGVCLTAVSFAAEGFEADVSAESLSRTTLGQLKCDSPVNLELAMRPDTRFGGHIVSGHVDGLGKVLDIRPVGESIRLRVQLPNELACYVAQKGSVTIDGVSLTVNAVQNNEFEVNIVPHTQQETIIGHYKLGSHVNIEVDIIARYVERMLQCGICGTGHGTGHTNSDDSLLEKIHDMMDDGTTVR